MDSRESTNRRRSSQSRQRSRSGQRGGGVNIPLLAGIIAVVLILIFVIIRVRSCGGNTRSATGVVRTLVEAQVNGNTKRIKECYGVTGDFPSEISVLVSSMQKYYKAHQATGVRVISCDRLLEQADMAYVYIYYELALPDGQSYPRVETYMVGRNENDYYIMRPSQITDSLRYQTAEAYEKFMAGETYKTYVKNYDTFIRKNPGYEEKINNALSIMG